MPLIITVFSTIAGVIITGFINYKKDKNDQRYKLFKDFYYKRIDVHQNRLSAVHNNCDNMHEKSSKYVSMSEEELKTLTNNAFYQLRNSINANRLWSDNDVFDKGPVIT